MRRMFLGMTLREVAEPLGVSYQQMQKIETGKNRISASKLYEVSLILDVPIDWFFEGVGEMN